jgi:hypothetical protein
LAKNTAGGSDLRANDFSGKPRDSVYRVASLQHFATLLDGMFASIQQRFIIMHPHFGPVTSMSQFPVHAMVIYNWCD